MNIGSERLISVEQACSSEGADSEVEPMEKTYAASLTIEAAIVLPITLLVMFTIVFMMQVLYVHEQIHGTLVFGGQQMAAYAYAFDKTGILDMEQEAYQKAMENSGSLETDLEGLKAELIDFADYGNNRWGGGTDSNGTGSNGITEISAQDFVDGYEKITQLIEYMKIILEDVRTVLPTWGVANGVPVVHRAVSEKMLKATFSATYSQKELEAWGIVGGLEGMDFEGTCFMLEDEDLHMEVHYLIEIPFLPETISKIPMSQRFTVRAFTGNENFESGVAPIEAEEGEGEPEGEQVYVTRTGKRYHRSESCNYIDIKLDSKLFSEISGSKRPCEVCGDDAVLTPLSIVHTTRQSGIYHTTLNCKTIKREVRTVALTEARTQGYTPCSKCGGE